MKIDKQKKPKGAPWLPDEYVSAKRRKNAGEHAIVVRIPIELFDEVKNVAKRLDRSVNATVKRALEKYVANEALRDS